ncbi:MAG: RnfABCDGE type electron transport complex subunit G [Acutalibacteraceae bacterium]
MKKLTPKAVLLPTAILIIICAVIAGLLAGTNALTKEPIAKQDEQKAQQTREIVMPGAGQYKELALENTGDFDAVEDCYAAYGKDGELLGYTMTASENGYGGPVQVMIGIDARTDSVSGVAVLSHSETPGLGANAQKTDFTDQYKQKIPESGYSVIKNAEPKEGEIQALTGATITSNAVTKAVNSALDLYENALKGKEPDKNMFK